MYLVYGQLMVGSEIQEVDLRKQCFLVKEVKKNIKMLLLFLFFFKFCLEYRFNSQDYDINIIFIMIKYYIIMRKI